MTEPTTTETIPFTLARIEAKLDRVFQALNLIPVTADKAPDYAPVEPATPVLDPNRKFGGNWSFLDQDCDAHLGFMLVQAGSTLEEWQTVRHQKVLRALKQGGGTVLTRRDTAYLLYQITATGRGELSSVERLYDKAQDYLDTANDKAAESGCGPVKEGVYAV